MTTVSIGIIRMIFAVFALLAQSRVPPLCLHKHFKHKNDIIKCLNFKFAKNDGHLDWMNKLPDELRKKVSKYCETTENWSDCYGALLHYYWKSDCLCESSYPVSKKACRQGCNYFKSIKGEYGY